MRKGALLSGYLGELQCGSYVVLVSVAQETLLQLVGYRTIGHRIATRICGTQEQPFQVPTENFKDKATLASTSYNFILSPYPENLQCSAWLI